MELMNKFCKKNFSRISNMRDSTTVKANFKKNRDRIINKTVAPVCQIIMKKAKTQSNKNILGYLGTLIISYLAKYIFIWLM